MEIASAFISLVPSAKGWGSKLNSQIGPDIEKAGRDGGSRFGRVFASASMSPLRAIGAAAVGLFAADKIKDALSFGLDVAAQNEQAQISFETMLGSAKKAGAFIKDLQQFAATTPFDFPGLQKSASSLISAGINAKKVIPIMTTLGDVTSGMGTGAEGIQRATIALQQMNAAGKIQAEDLNQLRDAGIPVYDLLAASLGKTKAQVLQLAQTGGLGADALTKMMRALETGKGLERFSGLMDKQSQSLTGLISTFKDNLGQGLANALAPAIPQIKRFLAIASTAVAVGLPKIASTASDAIQKLTAVFGPLVTVVSGFVKDHLQPFMALLSGLGGGAVAAFASLIGGTLVSAIGALVGALASPVVLIGALAGAAVYAYTHFAGFRDVVNQVAAYIKANVVPALMQFAGFLKNQVLPVVLQFADFVRSQVLPVILQFAGFLAGKLIPAIVGIWVSVGQRLRPVFDQLVATFRGSVLPALQQIVAKFREWQPTIQRVISVVVQVSGAVLRFAASVLGKVLPVVIRFAGFLLSRMVPAVLGVITVLFRIIGVVIRVGGAFVDAIAHVARFAAAVSKKIGEVIGFVRALPGKITGALGDAATLLMESGRKIVQGLIDGIKEKGKDVAGAVKGVLSNARDLLPFSPAKKGPFSGKGWTLYSGRSISEALGRGIAERAPEAVLAVSAMATKIARALAGGISAGEKKWVTPAIKRLDDAVGKLVDKAKSKVDDLKQKFSSVRDSVAQAFGGDLFSASNTGSFMAGLLKQRGLLGNLLKAQKTLQGWRLDPNFLSALFASGNSNLILGLAAGGKSAAVRDANLYGAVIGQQQSLGVSQANYQFGQQLNVATRQLDRLELIEKNTRDLDKKVARALSQASAKGAKKKKR